MYRGDIYYCDMNPVVGSEQGGVRPVLIVQNDYGNIYSNTVIVVPITAKTQKKRLQTHVNIWFPLPKRSIIETEQIRTVDKSRLLNYVGTLTRQEMIRVDNAIMVSLGL